MIRVMWWVFVTGFVLGMLILALILASVGVNP